MSVKQLISRNKLVVIGAMIFVLMVLAILVGKFILSSPDKMDTHLLRAVAPRAGHLLGTDTLGRDGLARLLAATGHSLINSARDSALVLALCISIGILLPGSRQSGKLRIGAAVITLLVAIEIGFMMRTQVPWRFVVAFLPVPRVVLEISVAVIVGTLTARRALIANSDLAVRRRIAATTHRLVPLICVVFAFTILNASRLAYLGLGSHSPTPQLGDLINDNSDAFARTVYPWLWMPPYIAMNRAGFPGGSESKDLSLRRRTKGHGCKTKVLR